MGVNTPLSSEPAEPKHRPVAPWRDRTRQVTAPAKPKRKLWRRHPAAPAYCGAVNPERPGIVDDETGDKIADPITCTAVLDYKDGKPVPHRGRHRATILTGITERWS